MSTDSAHFAAPGRRSSQDIRRTKVAPLLAAGLSVRAISAETGIPVGAVHRAKRRLEKIVAQGGEKAAAISLQLPTSYVVKQDFNGVMYDVRRLTVRVNERAVESAIWRGLLGRYSRDDPWAVVSALFASMFDDYTMDWLSRHGYLRWDKRGQAEMIISGINALIARLATLSGAKPTPADEAEIVVHDPYQTSKTLFGAVHETRFAHHRLVRPTHRQERP